jgi:hypothetical protein
MNNPYSSGTADVWYSGTGGDLWLEYKFLPRKPQRGVVDPMKLLSPLQARWLRERNDEGRVVGVCVGCSEGGILLFYREWETEQPYLTLLTRKELATRIRQITMR